MALNLNALLDLTLDEMDPLLEDLQGNILKGHGREHSVHLFLKLHDGSDAATASSKWIETFANAYVTSARKQLLEAEDLRRSGIPGGLFANFFFSGKGYSRLGLHPP